MSSGDVTERGTDGTRGRSIAADACSECDGRILEGNGERYCSDCGLVVTERVIDRGPEWRSIESERRRRDRTGAPVTIARHDRGLSTEIGRDHIDSGRKRQRIRRQRRHHSRARFDSKADRNLALALGEIARVTSALDLPYSARERASAIYRRAQREGLPVGRSIEAIATGSIYAACRCGGWTRSVDEIAAVARCSAADIELGFRVLNRELGLPTRVSLSREYLPTLLSAVDAPDAVRRRAAELAEAAETAGVSTGCHPGGVAAACVYRAGHENGQLYTQAELAEAVGITPTTLRKRYSELRELLE